MSQSAYYLTVHCVLLLIAHGSCAFVDLTHDFDENAIYWPTAESFNLTYEFRKPSEGGFWYETENIAGSTHGGTHLDAPAHFFKDRWHVENIPISQLVGPAVFIDIRDKAKTNPIAQVTTQDIVAWEQTYGLIPPNSIVVMQSGWTARWSDKLSYLGTLSKNTSLLKFPGWDPSAAMFLLQHRKINGIGVDTPSVDFGPSPDFKTHQLMAEKNKFMLENVKIPDNIPLSGARIMAMPMKIKKGSGAPCRIVAMWGNDHPLVSGSIMNTSSNLMFILCFAVSMMMLHSMILYPDRP